MARKPRQPKKPRIGSGERFSKLERSLERKGVKNPEAVAASIGRRKYGKARMTKLAAVGQRRAIRKRRTK